MCFIKRMINKHNAQYKKESHFKTDVKMLYLLVHSLGVQVSGALHHSGIPSTPGGY